MRSNHSTYCNINDTVVVKVGRFVLQVLIIITVFVATMRSSSATAKQNQSPPSSSSRQQQLRNLRLVVFDLDYTIWQPEMYQLYSQPRLVPIDDNDDRSRTTGRRRKATTKLKSSSSLSSQIRTMQDGMMITDGSGTPIRVFPGA
jgi:Acid Phosphatase